MSTDQAAVGAEISHCRARAGEQPTQRVHAHQRQGQGPHRVVGHGRVDDIDGGIYDVIDDSVDTVPANDRPGDLQ